MDMEINHRLGVEQNIHIEIIAKLQTNVTVYTKRFACAYTQFTLMIDMGDFVLGFFASSTRLSLSISVFVGANSVALLYSIVHAYDICCRIIYYSEISEETDETEKSLH